MKLLTTPVMEKMTKVELAQALGISRSLLYYQHSLPAKDLLLKGDIEQVLSDHSSYGHKRIAWELKVNRKRVLRVMTKFGIKPYRRRVKPKEANVNKKPAIYINLIKGICPLKPHVIWAADFTWIPYQGSFLYLATLLDVYTREIVGWSISRYHTTALVVDALDHALKRTTISPHYHHCDQGSEYDSNEYIRLLNRHQVAISMSTKGHPWENGYQESFYSQFKLDLGDPSRFDSEGELIEAIYQAMHYYNTKRIHTSLKMPPRIFREQYILKNQTNQQLLITQN